MITIRCENKICSACVNTIQKFVKFKQKFTDYEDKCRNLFRSINNNFTVKLLFCDHCDFTSLSKNSLLNHTTKHFESLKAVKIDAIDKRNLRKMWRLVF